MIGFLIGTVCLVGLFKVLRGMRRFGSYGGHCHGGHWGGHGGHGRWGRWGGGGRGGGFMRMLYERLETTPGQERVIAQAFDDVKAAAEKLRPASKGLEDLASALKAESFDEGAAAKFSVEAEESFGQMKSAVLDALRKVHEALDPRQRAILAELLERRAGGFFGGFNNPYRRTAWV